VIHRGKFIFKGWSRSRILIRDFVWRNYNYTNRKTIADKT